MTSQKQKLLIILEEQKVLLKDLQSKCELQNKKIKLFRKQNQELISIIEQRNQIDTNLLLQSKQILSHNAKLQKAIEEIKQQIEIARKNKQKNRKNFSHIENSVSMQSSNISSKILQNFVVVIKGLTVTSNTLELDLPKTELKDNDLFELESFRQLKVLIANENLLTDRSVLFVCSKFLELEKLNLASNQFTAQSFQNINQLKNLKLLDIRNNDLGDEAIIFISALPNLHELSCSKNNLTDKAASYLQVLQSLVYLDITNNKLTSKSAQHFSRLQKLTHLYLMSNQLSKDGIIELIKTTKNLLFLDVRFNVWNNQQKQEIKNVKQSYKMQVFY